MASQVPLASIPITERLANAALACVAYLHQMFWPAGLAPFYPYSKVTPMWDAGVALLWVLGISAALMLAGMGTGGLLFAMALCPVSAALLGRPGPEITGLTVIALLVLFAHRDNIRGFFAARRSRKGLRA